MSSSAADLLGVNVYTFVDGRWLKYSCSRARSSECIYVDNVGGNHNENVVCVCEAGLLSCYGYWTAVSDTGYNIRTRSKEKEPLSYCQHVGTVIV